MKNFFFAMAMCLCCVLFAEPSVRDGVASSGDETSGKTSVVRPEKTVRGKVRTAQENGKKTRVLPAASGQKQKLKGSESSGKSAGKNAGEFKNIEFAGSFFAELYESVSEYTRNDPYSKWIFSLFAASAGLLLALLMRRLLRIGSKRADRGFAGYFAASCAQPIAWLVLSFGLYLALMPFLAEAGKLYVLVSIKALLIYVSVLGVWIFCGGVDACAEVLLKNPDRFDPLLIGVLKRILKVIVGIIAFLFIGQNLLNLNITALLAGAGVAGLAIAFAAQDSIANFFGSIMLIIDKPFTVGDVVKIDSYIGIVERVGLRSTALRGLDGHLFTIPNKNAAGVPVENISERPSIKNVFNLGLTYDTSPEKMRRAMEILHEIFTGYEGYNPASPALIHFTEFKDFSLNIQVVAWLYPGDYVKNLEFTNRSNLEILRRFNEEGLSFAFPTHTNHLMMPPISVKAELCGDAR